MSARLNRGKGNNNTKAYQSCKMWDSIKKVETDGCKHNKIKFMPDGKVCKDCGDKL